MSNKSQEELLGQLEREVKLVFEHTGRLFAAAARNNGRTAPTAQVSKLKQTLRTSDRRFHEALDLLENELQTAKLVMRRDLALLPEESLSGKPLATQSTTTNGAQGSEIIPTSATDVNFPQTDAVEDTLMQDAEPAKTEIQTGDDPKKAITSSDAQNSGESKVDATNVTTEQDTSLDSKSTEQKPPETGLAIDTNTQPTNNNAKGESAIEEDKPPDTATFSNANDFDSLFGGPMSAGPVDAAGFDLGADANDDFDFDAFASSLENNNGADNDNISALLPGLEDYANTQPGGVGETDFENLFNPIDADGEQGSTTFEQGSTTFDDLGDLLDFNTEFNGGAEGGNDEFDFSTQ